MALAFAAPGARGRLGKARFDQPEPDAVDVDVVAAPLFRHRARQPDDAGFTRRVTRLAGISVGTRDRRDVHYLTHDAPAFGNFALRGIAAKRGRCAQPAKRRRDVNVQHGLTLLVGSCRVAVFPR